MTDMDDRCRSRDKGRTLLPVRTCVLSLLASMLLAAPAIAIDFSKVPPPDARPPGVPRGWGHWWAALEYLKEGNCQGAINESSYLLKNPQFSDAVFSQKALILHGDCFQAMGRPGDAMRAYLLALKKYGSNEEAFLKLGDVYLREENPAAAIRAYRGAVKVNQDSLAGHSGLATACLALGNREEAEAAIARVEELGGDVDELRKQLSTVTK